MFEKFVFVLEISAARVEELCGTNSRFLSFSETIVGRFLSVTSLMTFTLGMKLTFIENTGIFFGSQKVYFEDFYRIFRN